MSTSKDSSFVDSIPKPLLLFITVSFTALTAYAGYEFGVIGIFREGVRNSGTLQILVDLFICGFFFIAWLKHDAQRMNRSFLLWTIVTLTVGSFGPLLYLLTRKPRREPYNE